MFLSLFRIAWLRSRLTVYEHGMALGADYAVYEQRVMEFRRNAEMEEEEMAERLAM